MSKSAMQELIDELDFFKNILWKSDKKNESILVKDIIRKAVLKLEKEKEQIITDYSNGLFYALGYKHQDKNIDYGVTMQSKAEAYIYYNQTYNQNK
jgi:hypothetical protein